MVVTRDMFDRIYDTIAVIARLVTLMLILLVSHACIATLFLLWDKQTWIK